MALKYTQYSNLDLNIEVDRSSNVAIDLSVILRYPPIIRFGEEVQFVIENWQRLATYEVDANRGTARVEDDIIYYKAPDDYGSGNDTLYVTMTIEPVKISYFPGDGVSTDYYYDEAGVVHFVQDRLDDPDEKEGFKEYLERLRKYHQMYIDEAADGAPVIRLQHYAYTEENTLEGADYRIEETFGEWAHVQRSWKDDGPPAGGYEQYHVPSNVDLTPNKLPNLYGLKDKTDRTFQFGFKSRNSNEDEALGNVLEGYRYYGAIGSAVIITNTGDNNRRTFEFDIPLDLYDLTAIVPPEILSLCITSLEIKPILQGIPDGHTFLWEQISGNTSEVTWISDPTDVDLVISLGKIKTDRVFRFWISKGTKYEKYYDVIVYGTPRDEIVGLPSANNNFEVMGTNLGTGKHETRPILLTAERLWIKELNVKFIDKVR